MINSRDAFPRTSAEARPGGYALELRLLESSIVRIGKLGRFDLSAGVYVYLGSAHGPGGLRGRLERHLRPAADTHPHWNIDYLRMTASVVAGAFLYSMDGAPLDLECCWSQTLAALPDACIPAAHFGAADCHSGCPAHLIGFSGNLTAGEPVFLGSARVQDILAHSAGVLPHCIKIELYMKL